MNSADSHDSQKLLSVKSTSLIRARRFVPLINYAVIFSESTLGLLCDVHVMTY